MTFALTQGMDTDSRMDMNMEHPYTLPSSKYAEMQTTF
jgi:hypothetical protein